MFFYPACSWRIISGNHDWPDKPSCMHFAQKHWHYCQDRCSGLGIPTKLMSIPMLTLPILCLGARPCNITDTFVFVNELGLCMILATQLDWNDTKSNFPLDFPLDFPLPQKQNHPTRLRLNQLQQFSFSPSHFSSIPSSTHNTVKLNFISVNPTRCRSRLSHLSGNLSSSNQILRSWMRPLNASIECRQQGRSTIQKASIITIYSWKKNVLRFGRTYELTKYHVSIMFNPIM